MKINDFVKVEDNWKEKDFFLIVVYKEIFHALLSVENKLRTSIKKQITFSNTDTYLRNVVTDKTPENMHNVLRATLFT